MASYGFASAPSQSLPQPPPHYHAASMSAASSSSSHPHRSRRGPRIASQNAHRQYKAQRSPKEALPEAPAAFSEYLARFEAAKSFEFDDDEVFCPFHLLTEDDLQSIHSSSSSDRGSLTSGSPESSPLQHQVQPTSHTPSFLLSASTPSNMYSTSQPTPSYPHNQHHNSFAHHHQQQHQQMKLHQPLAQRTRNAIPIVDPSTRSVASPPLSVSPARGPAIGAQQFVPRRW